MYIYILKYKKQDDIFHDILNFTAYTKVGQFHCIYKGWDIVVIFHAWCQIKTIKRLDFGHNFVILTELQEY